MVMRGFIQYVGNPSVEAFITGLSCCGNGCMDAGRKPQGQFTGVWFIRFLSQSGAGFKTQVLKSGILAETGEAVLSQAQGCA